MGAQAPRGPRGFLAAVAAGCLLAAVASVAAGERSHRAWKALVTSRKTGTFDARAWRAGSIGDRGRMVDDLMRRGILDGRPKAEILGLLGKPDREDGSSVSYEVDVGHRFLLDPWTYMLDIEFGPDSRARSIRLLD